MIRVGVIGCGYWGPNLVRTLNELEEAELVRVSDLRPGRLEFVASRYPKVEVTAEAADIIQDESIVAVFIATPPDTHFAIARQALQAGKHVLVEKPLTMLAAEADQLVAMAGERNRILAVGHLFLYAPAVVKLKALLDSGELGDVHYVSATRSNLGPPNTKVDVLWDLAPHDISIILHLMGESPSQVTAQGSKFTSSTFAEAVSLTLRFSRNRMAQVFVSWLTPYKVRLIQAVGSRRTAVYDDMEPVHKVRVYDAAVDNRVNAKPGDASALSYGPGTVWMPAIPGGEPLRAECADFVRSVASAARPVSDGASGAEVVRVLEYASESLRRAAAGQDPTVTCAATHVAGVRK